MDQSTREHAFPADAPQLADSRQRILSAALELMSEHGYAGTSMSMIRKRSGVAASSAYWHFGSKESLLASVVEYSAREWLASLPRWERMSGTPVERLAEMVDRAAASVVEQPFLRVLMLLALERASSEESMAVIRRVRTTASGGFRKAFSEIFTSADDEDAREFANELAMFCLAVSDGIFLAAEIDRDVDVRRLFRFLRTSFMAVALDFVTRRDDHFSHRNAPLDRAEADRRDGGASETA
jgi:AcrR family transcriptional regulator